MPRPSRVAKPLDFSTVAFALDLPDSALSFEDEVAGPDPMVHHTTMPCRVHSVHKPMTPANEIHHIWPIGLGGPRVRENMVVVCPTGHRSIHLALRMLIAYRGELPGNEASRFGPAERLIAALGFDRLKRKAL